MGCTSELVFILPISRCNPELLHWVLRNEELVFYVQERRKYFYDEGISE